MSSPRSADARARRAAGSRVLGSTGSIGRQTLDVLAAHPDAFEVVALAAGLERGGCSPSRPPGFGAADHRRSAPMARRWRRSRPATTSTSSSSATGGIVSLRPVLAALARRQGRRHRQQGDARRRRPPRHAARPGARRRTVAACDARRPVREPARLAPPDRLRALGDLAVPRRRVDGRGSRRSILTASGGPFLDGPRGPRRRSPREQALRHPTWSMGAKITIDSATLANKGLEVIEAHWLYDVDDDAIEVVIHPQSVVHSAVRFVDGSLKAQLGTPDMRTPDPVRPDLPRPPPVAVRRGRPRRGRPPRLPRARRGPLPGAADRPRGRPDRPARDDRADRRRRRRGRAVPRRDALGFAGSRPCSRPRSTRFGEGADQAPDVEALVALDAEVRAAFAHRPDREPRA